MRLAFSKRAVAVGIVVLVLLGIAVFRDDILRFAASKGLGAATGTSVSFGSIRFGGGHATLTDVRMVGHGGSELAFLPRVDITYNLRELLPGSSHRYGLHSVTVYHPRITVVHNPDGTYNLPKLPKAKPSKSKPAPLNMTLKVIDGSVTVIDHTRVDPAARRLQIASVNVDADVHTDARTKYTASMAYVQNRAYPIDGRGIIDAPDGFTLHHWTAARVPLPQLVNYALNNANIRMRAGYLEHLDARYYGSISATAYMSGARISMQGVNAPIADVHGPLDVTSAGLTTPQLVASVAGAPVYVSGGIYDLKAPKFRLTVQAHSDAARLKQLAAAAAKLPMSGPIDLAMLVEGPVRTPLALISLRSPEIDYRGLPLRDAQGVLAFDGKAANVLHFTLRYSGFSLAARGRMALQKERGAVEAVASVSGPSDDVPYASAILPATQLDGTLLASGDDLKHIQTNGVLNQSQNTAQLAAVFQVSQTGVGTVALHMPALDARVALDHPHNDIAALVHADNLALHPAQVAALPGFNVKSPPPVRGTLTGNLFAAQDGKLLGLRGNVDVSDASFENIAISQAHAQFAGTPGNIGVASLNAQGSFGSLQAHGAISGTNHVALEGRLNGSLSGIGAFVGHLPASGTVNAPIALIYDGSTGIAQVSEARFSGASLRGIPIHGLSATVGTSGKALRVYAARADLSNAATALAAGSIDNGRANVALSVHHFALAALHSAGLPVSSGYADLAAIANGTLRAPEVNGALLVENASYSRYPIDGSAGFGYAEDTLDVRDAIVGFGPAIIAADGSVGGIRIGAAMVPQYDLNAQLRAADAHALIALAQPKLAREYIEGSIDAAVHVGGAGRSPSVSGSFDVPQGSVHGLAFRDLRATLRGTAQHFNVQSGHVAVGSTTLAFAAAVGGGTMSGTLAAPHADLADFNDYFDTGDTLAGTGRLDLSAATSPSTFTTSGNVDLADVRFHRFDIGTSTANWRTSGHSIALAAQVGGTSGTARLAGTVAVQQVRSIAQIATDADLNLAASVRDVDLGTWLPLLGFSAPVTGRIDADATVRGHYPDVSLNARANVVNGVVGRVPLQQAQLAVGLTRGRGQIQQLVVQIPDLSASGSGTFGLHAGDPLALSMHATSPDLGALLTRVSGKPNDAAGTLDTTLRIGGTRAEPQLRDDFTLASLRYAKFQVPKLFGTLAGNLHTVTLEHAEVDLKRGRVLAASGSAPLHLTRNAPVVFNLSVDNVDFSDFQSALPQGYRLAGTMAGQLHVRGTMDAPQLDGVIGLHNGYFVGPIDQNPIQKINGTLAFAGNTVAIRALHADVGGGTMDMNATATVANFRSPKSATFTSTIVAKGAQFNSPKYFRGKVDANITAFRNAGGIATIGGTVDIPSARIPLTAFWNPKASKTPQKATLPLAFNLRATVGNDVRVQSTGVDVGAQGGVTVAGTLASPTLNGAFTSTGGTIDFLRRFTIQSANVKFDPSNGIMPYVNAVATTQVSNPFAYVALHVTGLAPNNMQSDVRFRSALHPRANSRDAFRHQQPERERGRAGIGERLERHSKFGNGADKRVLHAAAARAAFGLARKRAGIAESTADRRLYQRLRRKCRQGVRQAHHGGVLGKSWYAAAPQLEHSGASR